MQTRFFLPNSFAVRLAFWFAGSAVLLVLIITLVIDRIASESLQRESAGKLAELAYQITDKLDQGMFERYREVSLLARRRELGDPEQPLETKQAALDALQDTYPLYAWIGVTDNTGQVLAATKGLLKGVNVAKRPWYINAQQGQFVGDLHEAKLLAKLLSTDQGEPKRFLDIALPYQHPDGAQAGILGVHLSWAWAREVQASVIQPAQQRGRVEAMILSTDGKVLLGPEALQNTVIDIASLNKESSVQNHFLTHPWSDGKSYLVGLSQTHGYRDYPGLGWKVLVRQSTDEAFKSIRQLQRDVIVVGLSAALLFSLFGIYNARRLTRSLRQLAHAARRVEMGQERFIAPGKDHPYIEIKDLSRALNRLLESLTHSQDLLQDANTHLESRVQERTEQLTESENRLRAIADQMPVLIAHLDAEQRFQFCNRTFEHWFGLPIDQVLGKTMAEVMRPALLADLLPYVHLALQGQSSQFAVSNEAVNHRQYLHMHYIPDGKGGFYSLTQDVTDSQKRQELLEHEINHDMLTGLPNRLACMARIQSAMARARRHALPMAVMFLDLNRFKEINDNFGHEVGDKVLIEFARRVKTCMRETDTVARLAGDEFVVIAECLVNGIADTHVITEKILEVLREPMSFDRYNQTVRTSIGMALYQSGDEDAAALLRRADEAMYQDKRHGLSPVQF